MEKNKMAKKDIDPSLMLTPRQEALLRAAKEVALKYIETGRLSVAAFGETFPQIYATLERTLDPESPREPEPSQD